MNYHPPRPHDDDATPDKSLIGWLLGRDRDTRQVAPREALTPQERFELRHGPMMESLSGFLARTGLDPIPQHLELAWYYLNGSSPEQRELIDNHIEEHDGIAPIDASGLLDQLRTEMSERDLMAMVEKVKADILTAVQTTDQSGRDAADFKAALGGSVHKLKDPAAVEETVGRLQKLTLDMVERTARAEVELKARSTAMAQLRSKLVQSQKEALSDALTGLPNRRSFDRQLLSAVEQAKETQRPLAVAFCDIDRFKRINDEHGHPTGDRVIRHVAQILKNCAGARAHVARHGGEEYAMLFEGMSAIEASEVLNQARARLDAKRLISKESNEVIGTVTISCGIAMLKQDETASALLTRADHAMYDAKNAGRNRIIVAP